MKDSTVTDFGERFNVAREAAQDVGRQQSFKRWPNPLDIAALHGLAGEIIRTLGPHTEADDAAILTQTLVMFGNAVGRGPRFIVEADRHGANLDAVLVGETAKGRKGTSHGQVRSLFDEVDQRWATEQIKSGLSSGEGLIWAVRDPIEKEEPVKEKGRVVSYQTVRVDPGVLDKRLLVVEPELANVLKVQGREGNNLSATIRQAWDSGTLRTLTKNSPAVATGAHVSILGHITKQELLRHLDSTEMANGFANRFLWVCVRRSKLLPEGGSLTRENRQSLIQKLAAVLEFGREAGELKRDARAAHLWREVYADLSGSKPGIFGAATSRAEAQVVRLSLIYALLDCSREIRAEHLAAALAVWSYCEDSAKYIFGDATGDRVADEILRGLRSTPAGLTLTEISEVLGRNVSAGRISIALELLQSLGYALPLSEPGPGRPTQRWRAV